MVQSGAIDDATDVAVELDEVGDTESLGLDFEGSSRPCRASLEVLVAEQGVVVDGQLASTATTRRPCERERIDFDEAGVVATNVL